MTAVTYELWPINQCQPGWVIGYSGDYFTVEENCGATILITKHIQGMQYRQIEIPCWCDFQVPVYSK